MNLYYKLAIAVFVMIAVVIFGGAAGAEYGLWPNEFSINVGVFIFMLSAAFLILLGVATYKEIVQIDSEIYLDDERDVMYRETMSDDR